MNPQYGQYQQFFPNQNQNNTGLPQPQWQAAPQRPRWYDPRENAPQPGSNVHPLQAPQVPSYYTASSQYGPMQHANPPPTTTPYQAPPQWGVKYTQAQSQPPLPPRPPSTTGWMESPASPSQPQWQGRPGVTHLAAAHQPQQLPPQPWLNHFTQQQQSQAATPPPPPPRPPEYQNQQLYNAPDLPHEQYSHKPPSHHYEPSINPSGDNAYISNKTEPPHESDVSQNYVAGLPSHEQFVISPVEPQSNVWSSPAMSFATTEPHASTLYDQQPGGGPLVPSWTGNATALPTQSATALGHGGPSGWEYFTPEPASPESTYDGLSPTHAQNDQHNELSSNVPKQSSTVGSAHTPVFVSELADNVATAQDEASVASQKDDESSSNLVVGLHRTGSIDSVIQVWNAPLQPRKTSPQNTSATVSNPPTSSPVPEPSHSRIQQQDLRPQTPIAQNVNNAPSVPDPHADLEAHSRASLARYVTMLRKEAAADSDEEKFKVFSLFVQKETRLRAVLYDIEMPKPIAVTPLLIEDPKTNEPLGPIAEIPTQAVQDQNDNSLQTHILSDNIPVIEPPRQHEIVATPLRAESPKAEESPRSNGGSFIVVDQAQGNEDEEYSPGGRPRIPRPMTVNTRVEAPPAPRFTDHPAEDTTKAYVPSPSDNAPMAVADYAMTAPESPALAAPIVLESAPEKDSDHNAPAASAELPTPANAAKFEPSRAVYTPFRYHEGPQNQPERLDVLRPADQAYALLRNQYVDSGRLMTHDAVAFSPGRDSMTSPLSAKREHEETFLGLIRSQSTARHKPKPLIPDSIRPRSATPSRFAPQDPIKVAVEALRALVSRTLPVEEQDEKVTEIRKRTDQIADDFSFIRETMLQWDRGNREIRKKLDEERHRRQEESERYIDELFNDNEIAYADIKGMEADFKLAEAERRYEEDKLELDSFSDAVYTPVTDRLQKAVDRLTAEYVLAVDLLDLESYPAGRMLTAEKGRASTSDAMQLVLQIFEKLNIRYQKLAEARFERERRRKRLELTVLHTNGDTGAIKNLEVEFATAEKLQVLQEARDKDTRANQLMDSFDRATVRALGDNQALIDDILARAKKLNDALLADGLHGQSDHIYSEAGARRTLSSAQSVVALVMADSRALLTTSNVADKILNDADYTVSLAEAKAANADQATHQKLQRDKEREDAKLVEEMGIRMDSITKGPADARELIQSIVARIGDDREHPERLKNALEEAKKRNAAKES